MEKSKTPRPPVETPPVAKKPKVPTIEEKALDEFKSILGLGPCFTEIVVEKLYFGRTSEKERSLGAYRLSTWISILETDPYMKMKIENILTFLDQNKLTTPWVKVFQGVLELQRAIDKFEVIFDDVPKDVLSYGKTTSQNSFTTSKKGDNFIEWVDSLNKLIYWKRDEQK